MTFIQTIPITPLTPIQLPALFRMTYPNKANSIQQPIIFEPPKNTLRKKFSKEEDDKLIKIVETFGSKNWEFISQHMPGRTARQCRDRYSNYLKPTFVHCDFSPEEDQLLAQKVKEFGSHWSTIQLFFQGRSGNALKNRWSFISSLPNLKELNSDPPKTETENNINESENDSDKQQSEPTVTNPSQYYDINFLLASKK